MWKCIYSMVIIDLIPRSTDLGPASPIKHQNSRSCYLNQWLNLLLLFSITTEIREQF